MAGGISLRNSEFRFESVETGVHLPAVVTRRFASRLVPGRTQVFGSLCVLVFFVNLGRVIYAPLLEPFRSTFDASAGAVGLLATLVWLGSALPRFPTAYLLTRVPRHRVVLATGFLLAGGSVLAASSRSLAMLYVGALSMGIASGVYYVSAIPLISELYPSRVGRAIGINGTASQIAAVAAPPAVGAVLAIRWPIAAWRVIFLGIALASAVSAVLFAITARRANLSESQTVDRDLPSALRTQWPLIATAIVFVGLTGTVWLGLFNLYGTYLVASKGFSEGTSRTMLTVVFATGVPAFWLTGSIADRVPFVPLLLAISAGFVACLIALIAAQGVAAVFAVSAVMGYVVHSLFPTSDTYLLSSFPNEHRGSAYALYSGTMMPIQATGGVVIGGLVDLGFAFDEVLSGFAVALSVLTVALALLYRAGRLPSGENG